MMKKRERERERESVHSSKHLTALNMPQLFVVVESQIQNVTYLTGKSYSPFIRLMRPLTWWKSILIAKAEHAYATNVV